MIALAQVSQVCKRSTICPPRSGAARICDWVRPAVKRYPFMAMFRVRWGGIEALLSRAGDKIIPENLFQAVRPCAQSPALAGRAFVLNLHSAKCVYISP